MPRKNPPTSTAIRAWIIDAPELQYGGTGDHVFCTACDTSFLCTQKSYVSRHIGTEKHKTNTGLETQTTFNGALLQFMVGCNIPWNQLNNPSFRNFLQNCVNGTYSNVGLPSESNLRKYYLLAERDRVKQNILKSVRDNNIWISVDEAKDAFGRKLACVAVGALVETTSTETHILACKQLERTNAETVTAFLHTCLRELWGEKYEENTNKLLLLLTDAAPYMKRAGQLLQNKYKNMLHLTCLADSLHRIAKRIRASFPKVDELITYMKQIFFKAPHRLAIFKQTLPRTPLPPKLAITRWGTWLEEVSYYYCYFNDIKNVIEQLDENESNSIVEVKQAYSNPDIFHDLSFIHGYFSRIPLSIKRLQTSNLLLIDAMNVIFDLRHYISQLPALVGTEITENIKVKLENILDSNPGFYTMRRIVDLFQKQEVDFSCAEVNVASLRHYMYFKYAPVTSVDVECFSSRVKWIFTDRRRHLNTEHLESLLLIYCNKYLTEGESDDCSNSYSVPSDVL